MAYNHIGDEGVKALALHLLGSYLTDCNLQENEFTSLGATYLAQAVGESRLVKLDISGNKICSTGRFRMISAMPNVRI